MGAKFDFDLIVIGSGSAGSASALSARESGLKVALVENSLWGGSGVNSRDLPFVSASTFSNLYHDSIAGARFGLSSKSLRYNFPTFKNWLKLAKKRSGANSKKSFESAGITCLKGIAHFLTPYEISVGDKTFSAKNFIIASGAVPDNGGIIGIESVKCLTPETAFDLSRPPKSLAVVGGGATGCEFAEFFASLGTSVKILEMSSRLLKKEDFEAGTVLEKYFKEEYKIETLKDARVASLSSSDSEIKITYIKDGKEKSLKTETVLLATGMRPALDLGLKNAGVKFNENGIFVNQSFRTSMKHIFAVGDCIGGESSSERAFAEGRTALYNLLKNQKLALDYDSFPRVVKTNPEIVSLGKTEEELKKKRIRYKSVFVSLSEAPVSNTADFRVGFLKLLVDKRKNTLLGATLMAKHADSLSSELSLAIRNRIPLEIIASTPHVASSLSELIRLSAQKALK